MAILKVADCFLDDSELFDVLVDSFDSIERVDKQYNVTTFRVMNDEIPKDDKQIEPLFMRFEGVRPFVIQWD